MPDGALEGIRVIELGQMVSAPYCGKLVGYFAADVVAVERRCGLFPSDRAHPELGAIPNLGTPFKLRESRSGREPRRPSSVNTSGSLR